MYILSIVDYSDRSSQLEVFNKYAHILEWFKEYFEDFDDPEEEERKARDFLDSHSNIGKFVYDEKEWEILEL